MKKAKPLHHRDTGTRGILIMLLARPAVIANGRNEVHDHDESSTILWCAGVSTCLILLLRTREFVHSALKFVDHRPWPLPSGPWIMQQIWNDLLFAHWPVASEVLQPLVPAVLELDKFEGQCWVAVTPFRMSGIRIRCLPPLPGLARFPELNVRTYVTFGGKPGVYFFSLDAGSQTAVWSARATYHLPYFYAGMRVNQQNGRIEYHSLRDELAEFKGQYRASGPIQLRPQGSLERWLTERYCLYTFVRNSVFRAEIHHAQWPLQDAEAEISRNTMAGAAGILLPDSLPLLHFSKTLEVLIWPLKKVINHKESVLVPIQL